MSWNEWLTLAATLATAVGVGIAAAALYLQRRQAISAFEADLTQEFRAILKEIPVAALIRRDQSSYEIANLLRDLGPFYRYIDLSNEQAFLAKKGVVRPDTWKEWEAGIKSMLSRPAMKRAYEIIMATNREDFGELRDLVPPDREPGSLSFSLVPPSFHG